MSNNRPLNTNLLSQLVPPTPTSTAPVLTADDVAKINTHINFLNRIDDPLQQTGQAGIITRTYLPALPADVTSSPNFVQPADLLSRLYDITNGGSADRINVMAIDLISLRDKSTSLLNNYNSQARELNAVKARVSQLEALATVPNPPVVVTPAPTAPVVNVNPPSNTLAVVAGVGLVGALAAGVYWYANRSRMGGR